MVMPVRMPMTTGRAESASAASSSVMALPNVAADGTLLRRAAAGESRAWRALVDAHSESIYRFAYRMLGERDAAEDVVQETFSRLWRQAHRWRPEAPLRAWLFRVAGNLAIDDLRKRRPVREVTPDDVEEGPGVEHRIAREEEAAAVWRMVNRLPDRQRRALILCRLEGMSMTEAGEVLGCSVGAVESLLSRARAALRAALDDTKVADLRTPVAEKATG